MIEILVFFLLTVLLFMISALIVWQIMEFVKKRKFNYLKTKLTNKHKYISYSDYLYMYWGQKFMKIIPNWLLIKLLRKKPKKK